MSTYISLGSNCSVAYQLKKRNLKTKSYPFDWCKISILQLVKVLGNNFNWYFESLEIKKISYNHSSLFNNYSLILKNIYDIEFAHEITNNDQLTEFKNKIKNRIDNFNSLTDKIIFIRIELKPIKKIYGEYIIKLVELLNNFSTNYILKIIINTDIQFNGLPSNVQIYKFNEFTSDWQMNHINWDSILGISTTL